MSSRKKNRASEKQVSMPVANTGPATNTNPAIGFVTSWANAFNQFWFTPRKPNVLGLIRLMTGLIAFYSIAVWTLELSTFFATDGLLPAEYRRALGGWAAWSHLDWFAPASGLAGHSSTGLMVVHVISLAIIAMFAAGFQTRVTSVLTALLVISYGNRSIGAGFGLDQIVSFLCLSCAIGDSGGAFSIDRWLAKSKGQAVANTSTNIAIRLIQVHMCIVYFFAAIGKLQGETWWTGEAVWLSMASYEYQQVDMTWLANYLPLVSAMTLVSLFWELFYSALIWPKLTRPIILAMAVPLHLGIGLCMGMMEFGLIMLVGNLAFVSWWCCGDEDNSNLLNGDR